MSMNVIFDNILERDMDMLLMRQFHENNADIDRHFEKANYIGFTGTPIFEANKGASKRTTADLFHAGKEDTLKSIGGEYGISAPCVRQLMARAK